MSYRVLVLIVVGLMGACGGGDDDDGLIRDDAGLVHGEGHESVSWHCTCNVFKIYPPNEPITSVKPVATFTVEPICIGQRDHAQQLAKAACDDYPGMNCGCGCCATLEHCTTTALDECLTGRGPSTRMEYAICTMPDIDKGGYRCSPDELR